MKGSWLNGLLVVKVIVLQGSDFFLSLSCSTNFQVVFGPFGSKQWRHIIKRVLVPTACKKLLPFRGFKIWFLLSVAHNCSKPIVEDTVVLRRHVSGVQVQDERDTGGMITREAKEFATARSGVPSWELLSVLNGWVEDIDGRSPHMQVMTLG
jgi:hypothetical protein